MPPTLGLAKVAERRRVMIGLGIGATAPRVVVELEPAQCPPVS
jgi:hypothetical protein